MFASVNRLGLVYLLAAGAGIVNADNAEHGKSLYDVRCTACHALDSNREGPAHRGVFGRKAGAVADFSYSSAVKNSGVTWNEKTLDKWLSNPEAFIPGQEMGFSVPDANERADIIAYLRTLSLQPQTSQPQSSKPESSQPKASQMQSSNTTQSAH